MVHLAQAYLRPGGPSLRQTAHSRGMAVGYATEEKRVSCFSHTTLWRLVRGLGTMTATLVQGTALLLQANPATTVHRFCPQLDPRKSRTPRQQEVLRTACGLLHLMNVWDSAFPETRFFPRFATRSRSP